MKGFQDQSFLMAFQRIMAKTQSTPTATRWTVGSVEWRCDRNAHTGLEYKYHIEIHRVVMARPKEWGLLFVLETWWYGRQSELTRRAHWGKVIYGSRNEVLGWFRAQEKLLQ
jgi:hypothetical protein